MAGRKSDFTLPKFDDIFSTQEMRDDEKLAKIRDIPLELMGERICTIPASIAFGHPNADLLGQAQALMFEKFSIIFQTVLLSKYS